MLLACSAEAQGERLWQVGDHVEERECQSWTWLISVLKVGVGHPGVVLLIQDLQSEG